MMRTSESQTIEFKTSWRDEYLKWICAFANTNGGKLLIGVDDNGVPVGVKDSKEWLEELKKGYDIEITDLSMKAFRLFREGKYDESGNCYEELYKQKKDIYYMDKATEMYRIAENWEKLLETSKVCSKKNPDNLLYQVYQAEAMLKTGDEEGALKLLEKAEKSAEGNTYFLSMIKEFYKNYGFEEEAQRIEQKQNQ